MPHLTNDQQTLYLVVAAGVAVVAFLVSVILAFRLRKVRREYAILRGDGKDRDIFAAVSKGLRRVEAIDRRVDGVVATQEDAAKLARFAIQKFGIVRYDAFEDMGGRMSFSAALLDDHGDGLVLTSINGRTETRTYAKEVRGLASEYNLSDEEQRAISEATSVRPTVQPETSASR
ncbi:MAG: DUF4446 family protein [Actinomycetota bacterium]|nr:DUF4446 family protein [Actinomycetota bacterium]